MDLTDNVILITGGASGIGYALAERFTQLGNRVIICGRRADALADAAAKLPGLVTKQVDLSSPAERKSLARWIESEHPGLNVLLNNAGIQQWMSVTDTDFADRATTEITTNIEAPVHLTSLFLALPNLKVVMNVTSGLAFSPLATVPVYSATKAFFRSFTLSLRHQLRSRGIEVIELIPPALNTDLGGKGLHDHAPPVAGFIDSAFEQLAAGKQEITYGFSEQMIAAGPNELRQAFERMNPST